MSVSILDLSGLATSINPWSRSDAKVCSCDGRMYSFKSTEARWHCTQLAGCGDLKMGMMRDSKICSGVGSAAVLICPAEEIKQAATAAAGINNRLHITGTSRWNSLDDFNRCAVQ